MTHDFEKWSLLRLISYAVGEDYYQVSRDTFYSCCEKTLESERRKKVLCWLDYVALIGIYPLVIFMRVPVAIYAVCVWAIMLVGPSPLSWTFSLVIVLCYLRFGLS